MAAVTWEELFDKLTIVRHGGKLPPFFSSLACHSAEVMPGALFCAISGSKVQGAAFIEEAIQKGATGCLVSEEVFEILSPQNPSLGWLAVPDTRLALAQAASLFFPKRPSFQAAVTGTSGKTSVVHFTRQLWNACGCQAASLGTLGLGLEAYEVGEKAPLFPTGFATPDPLFLHQCFERLAMRGITHCVLEASSHGLHQKRLHGTTFQVGVWTNLSRDHLDYHPTLEDYRSAKEELFQTRLSQEGIALLNADLPHLSSLQNICQERQIQPWAYGRKGKELTLLSTTPHLRGQEVCVHMFGKTYSFFLPFCGAFQAENILASIGIVHASGIPLSRILDQIEGLTPVPGRLEYVGHTSDNASVYVDYSHKPHALQVALESMRLHTQGNLHLVFGCGGDRDTGKRVEMGAIAHEFADHIMVTDDNPRHEDPAFIRSQILSGCPRAIEEGDRRKAIYQSIARLKAGDTLLIAGKGHETIQIYGEQRLSFDDRVVAKEILTECGQKERECHA